MATTKDPFGGHVTRRTIVGAPEKEEKRATLQEKIEQLRNARADSADAMLLENEVARLRNETMKLDQEYYNNRNYLNERVKELGGNPVDGNGGQPAQPAPFTGSSKLLLDVISLAEKGGIPPDVVSNMIAQILSRQPQYYPYGYPPPQQPPAAQNQPHESTVLMNTFGKIVEKSFENQIKPHESTELTVLKTKMEMQEMMLNKELQGIKEILLEKGRDTRTPSEQMTDSIKSMGTLLAALKTLQPEQKAPAAGDAELRFKYQEREWLHEETKAENEIKKMEIASKMQVEREKLEQSRQNIAMVPELIGGVIAQGVLEGFKKEPAGNNAPPPAQKQVINLDVSKSKDKAHGPITIKCPDCGTPVTFVTSAKKARCSACPAFFNIILHETEGGQTSIEANRAISDDNEDYGRGQ